jgi:hypothetical protein
VWLSLKLHPERRERRACGSGRNLRRNAVCDHLSHVRNGLYQRCTPPNSGGGAEGRCLRGSRRRLERQPDNIAKAPIELGEFSSELVAKREAARRKIPLGVRRTTGCAFHTERAMPDISIHRKVGDRLEQADGPEQLFDRRKTAFRLTRKRSRSGSPADPGCADTASTPSPMTMRRCCSRGRFPGALPAGRPCRRGHQNGRGPEPTIKHTISNARCLSRPRAS